MASHPRVTRRQFLVALGAASAGVLAACGGPAAPAPTSAPGTTQETVAPQQGAAPTQAPVAKFQQNPIWDEAVAGGKLPPVEQRLPEKPCVAPRKGKYGGVPKWGTTGAEVDDQINLGGGNQTKMRLLEDYTIVPNLYEDCVYSNDYKTMTFYMRKGLKWSDGQPYTTEDVRFWFEDVFMNDALTTAGTRKAHGNPKLTVIDEYTYKFDWDEPCPWYLRMRVAHIGGGNHAQPAHYLKKFHIKYNPKAEEEAKAEGFDSWSARYTNKATLRVNPELPDVHPFVAESVTVDRVTFKPNPYYWMVDEDGKQLPYFDGAVALRVADRAAIDAMILSGEIDIAECPWKMYDTLMENQEKGHYVVDRWKNIQNLNVYNFNLTCKDQVWRQVFNDVRFRRAMSVAINREEINNVIYRGLCTPGQFTAHVTTKVYKQEYSDAWAQYDPDLANKLLDEMGLKWDDKHELRVLPDGRPAEINTLFISWFVGGQTDMAVEYWKKIGIKVNYRGVERGEWSQAVLANEVMMSVWNGDEHAGVMICLAPKFFVPGYRDEACTATPWGLWYDTDGKQGEEPPAEFKQLYAWIDEFKRTDNWDLVDKILKFQADNLVTIGVINDPPKLYIHDADMKNVPDFCYSSWDNNEGKYRYNECFYFDKAGS